jgi:hypothetical protein
MRLTPTATFVADGLYAPETPTRVEATMDYPGYSSGRAESSSPHVTETLHSLERDDGRASLIVIVISDDDGHVLDVIACDAHDYDR